MGLRSTRHTWERGGVQPPASGRSMLQWHPIFHVKVAAHFDHHRLHPWFRAEETIRHDFAAERNINADREAVGAKEILG